jgi:hypothetical protein
VKYRYFHITETRERVAITTCEYFGDYGWWASQNALNRYSRMVGGQIWLVFSDLSISSYTVDALCLQMQSPDVRMVVVDLAAASNRKSERVPAMSRRGKK